MAAATFSLFAVMILTVFLSPFGYMMVTALKDRPMITKAGSPILPSRPATFSYQGEEYPVLFVPGEDGRMHEWAIIQKGREESTFIDPKNPEAGSIQWTGKWRTLESTWELSPVWENFSYAWTQLDMPLLLRNTVMIAVAGLV